MQKQMIISYTEKPHYQNLNEGTITLKLEVLDSICKTFVFELKNVTSFIFCGYKSKVINCYRHL